MRSEERGEVPRLAELLGLPGVVLAAVGKGEMLAEAGVEVGAVENSDLRDAAGGGCMREERTSV